LWGSDGVGYGINTGWVDWGNRWIGVKQEDCYDEDGIPTNCCYDEYDNPTNCYYDENYN